jgi:hypothetical protein
LLVFALATVLAATSVTPGDARQKNEPTGRPPVVTVPPPPGPKPPPGVCPCFKRNGVYAGYASAVCCVR